jgi:DNA-directed RNA polymerase II subunit RPB1
MESIPDNLAIGVLASSAVGADLTQTTLDTFHSAGIVSELISRGIFRIEELFNNSSTLYKITFSISKQSTDLENVVYTSLKHLIVNKPKLFDLKCCEWIERWETHFGKIELPEENFLLFEVWISIDNMLKANFDIGKFKKLDKFKPLAMSPLVIKNNTLMHQVLFVVCYSQSDVLELSRDFLYNSIENEKRIAYLSNKIWEPMILNLHLGGIKTVEKIIFLDNENVLVCNSYATLDDVLHIDPYNIVCNKTMEMLRVFGIEVAKRCLLEELSSIMPQILKCYIEVIVDKMTWSGTITSISRYAARTDPDPLKRISFEEAARNIHMACVEGEIDELKATSSQLVASKKI